MINKIEQKLSRLYFNPLKPGSFSGARSLQRYSNVNKSDVEDFLSKQWTYNLHKPVRQKFKRRRYVTSGMNRQWQADLVEMGKFAKENKNYKYMLTVIDIFSRYAYARPLKNKSGPEVADALKDIFKENRYITPKFIQTDQGKEFYNKHVLELLKKYDVKLFSVFTDQKSAVVERFNRTLKERMYRYFTFQGNHKWLEILPKLIKSYNNTYHSSIEQTPASVNKNNEMNVWLRQYSDLQSANHTKADYNIGDRVRISKQRGVFKKGYLPGWSDEEFTIHSINTKYKPILYYLQDDDGEILQGGFYKQELQKVNNPDKYYRIEKIIKSRTNKKTNTKEAYVKFFGYKTPMWINFDSMKNITELN